MKKTREEVWSRLFADVSEAIGEDTIKRVYVFDEVIIALAGEFNLSFKRKHDLRQFTRIAWFDPETDWGYIFERRSDVEDLSDYTTVEYVDGDISSCVVKWPMPTELAGDASLEALAAKLGL